MYALLSLYKVSLIVDLVLLDLSLSHFAGLVMKMSFQGQEAGSEQK